MLRVLLLIMGLLTGTLSTAFADTFPGGFIEPQGQFQRTKYTAAQIAAFIPAGRAAFTLPAPYSTRVIRFTQPNDCSGNQDCLYYVGYSYWANINNHVNDAELKVFLNFSPTFGGDGPNLFTYNKNTEAITKVGPMFSVGSIWRATGDGSVQWYWSGTLSNRIYMLDFAAARRKLLRLMTDTIPVAAPQETIFDLAGNFSGCTVSDCPFALWQAHSSADDTVHSFTIRDVNEINIGCLVYQPNRTPATRWYPKISGASMDECDIDLSGHYTLIKEFTNPSNSTTRVNRFFDNWTGTETRITTFANTLGHSSAGYGYFIGLGDPENLPGSVFYYLMNPFGRGAVQHYDADWPMTTMNHPTHLNAVNGAQLSSQMFCGSNLTTDTIRNEIICSLMDDSHRDLVVAPVMSSTNFSGGRFGRGINDGNFGLFPKGNLDVTGRYFIWTSNWSSSRLDAFMVKIPSQQFGGETDIHPPATPTSGVGRLPGAQITPAPRGFTLTFMEVCEAAMLLWSCVKYRAHIIKGYHLAGQKAFQFYWQWKVKRWLKAAPAMLTEQLHTIDMQPASIKGDTRWHVTHLG